jgi:hypothetical protein
MSDRNRLYGLLPAVFRQRDITGQLRALMALLSGVHDELQDDVAGLYEDSFIETCSAEMVPFLAARVGLGDLIGIPEERALVGNAIRWRRRKGVATVLQPLIREACGWWARVTETADATPKVTIEVWRAQPTAREDVVPHVMSPGPAPWLWSFTATGDTTPLQVLPSCAPPWNASAPDQGLPQPLTRAMLAADLAQWIQDYQAIDPPQRPADSALYGPEQGLAIYLAGAPVPPDGVVVAALGPQDRPPGDLRAALSDILPSTITLTGEPRLQVSFGGSAVYALDLGPVGQMTPTEAAQRLQTALAAVSTDPVAAQAIVRLANRRLLVIAGPGATTTPVFDDIGGDGVTEALKLQAPMGSVARRSAPADAATLAALGAEGSLALRVGLDGATAGVSLPLPVKSADALAQALQAAIRAATNPIFSDVTAFADNQAVVLATGAGAGPRTASLTVTGPSGAEYPASVLALRPVVALDPELGLFASLQAAGLASLSVDYGIAGPAETPGAAARMTRFDQILTENLPANAAIQVIWRS